MLNNGGSEKAFQNFFEANPCLVPGSHDEIESLIGPSGHSPFRQVLVTQPKIYGVQNKIPDFMWLASDSLVFNPVFIEIEAPDKKYFIKDGKPSANFSQALKQIKEWKSILNKPINQLKFFEDYNIPQDYKDLQFSPKFIFLYGRRSEYKDDKFLKGLRAEYQGNGEYIMSYDRINPSYMDSNFITCKVKDSKYHVNNITPMFDINSYHWDVDKLTGFENQIENIYYLDDSQKKEIRLWYKEYIKNKD